LPRRRKLLTLDIIVPGLDPLTVPGSPEDIRIPVPDSGTDTPAMLPSGGLSSPAEPLAFSFDKPPEPVVNTAVEAVRDKITDED
jgi:6-phosphofructo-2-kinase/fructose-2,6-biphosphatase 4